MKMKMKMERKNCARWALCIALWWAGTLPAWGFESGSSGADGALNLQVDTELALPADGVFHYTEVNIPEGVQLRFARNAQNTPVTWLVSGDVLIAGEVLLSGSDAASVGSAGDGSVGDDGLAGRGGPGGFDGGVGGAIDAIGSEVGRGGNGLGPGGPQGHYRDRSNICMGTGGSFAEPGGANPFGCEVRNPPPPPAYGNAQLLPLVGGSGGAGAGGGLAFPGSGGGGGGGALLIAASGTVTVSGSIRADGGRAGLIAGQGAGGVGGGGSGGALRIVATTLVGDGLLSATGGARIAHPVRESGGAGGAGRIRLEAETFQRSAGTTPAYSFAVPGEVFLAGLPSLRITTVGDTPAPAVPTGMADVLLPEQIESVEVGFATRNVPLGNVVRLRVVPTVGVAVEVISPALSGTLEDASARVPVSIPLGHSVLQASVSYTVSAEQGQALSQWAEGESVVQVELRTQGAVQELWLLSATGQQYHYPEGLSGPSW